MVLDGFRDLVWSGGFWSEFWSGLVVQLHCFFFFFPGEFRGLAIWYFLRSMEFYRLWSSSLSGGRLICLVADIVILIYIYILFISRCL